MPDEVMITGLLAVAVFLITLAVSVRKSAGMPTYESREAQLAKRITDLESQIRKHEATITTLQNLLYDRQAKVEELTERVRVLETNTTQSNPRPTQRKPSLVLAVGADRMLQVDIARLRGIRKLQLSVIEDATKSEVEKLLRQRRSDGRPIKLMQISAHSGLEGVAFSDGIADGLWFSEHLKDVEVLVLADCQSHNVASLLTTIPFVVSIRNKIGNEDASTFSFHFWFAISDNKKPEDAYYYALEKSSHKVSEMAEYHLYT